MCEKCDFRNEPKTYEAGNSITGVSWFFDVQIAMRFIKEYQLPTFTVPPELLQHTIEVNDVDESHIDHVNMSVPLIYGFVPKEPEPPCAICVTDGQEVILFMPLDGSHRAAKAVRDGIEVQGYFLNEAMTMACLVAIEDRKNGNFMIRQSAYRDSINALISYASKT